MRPSLSTDFDEEENEVRFERDLESRPERANRPNASRRVRVRAAAKRNRSNDVAKRGMHQRRRKRFSW